MAKGKNKSFFEQLVNDMKDDNISIADSELASGEFTGYIDTGSYALNALLSGTIHGGFPNNKILGLAGDEATGKSFFALAILRNFLDIEDSGAAIFETEGAVTKKMLVERGIDPRRVIIAEPVTVQDFRTQAVQMLDKYAEAENRPPMMYILDSLGQLSTAKEVEDISTGKDTKDMTRNQLIRGAFRVMDLKVARLKVPMIVTNHTYDQMDQYKPKAMSGGGGLKYAADFIVFLSKSKLKEGEKEKATVIGNIIHCKLTKSRLTREQQTVDVCLSFDKGLDRYYGLLEIAEKHGVFVRDGSKWCFGQDVIAHSRDEINENAAQIYNAEILKAVDAACKKEFCFGNDQ